MSDPRRNFVVQLFADRGLSDRLTNRLVLDRFHLTAVSADLTPFDDGEFWPLLRAKLRLHRFGFELHHRKRVATEALHVRDAILQLLDGQPGTKRSVDERVAFGRYRIDEVCDVL